MSRREQAKDGARPARRGRPPKPVSERSEEVLRTAARIFGKYGYRHATLEDIALELGLTRPALYHYARSKDELLSACANIAYGTLRGAVAEANGAGSGLERLRAFFQRYAEIICDDFGGCFVLTDRRELSEPDKGINRDVQLELGRAVQSMVAVGVADGSLGACNPREVSAALFGMFNGIPRWYRPEGGQTPREIADGFLGMIFDGIAKGA